ncbi:MAG: glycyl-radical enzyme activating protein [Clostridia bacterium]|nr:glycyl-radical enzyme activating protein [Clostridia bacterium]
MGTIFNVQKFCLHDGDGIRTCVFLKGCPLRCAWCHNPESLDKSPVVSFSAEKCTLCGRCIDSCPAREIKSNTLHLDRDRCTACGKCTQLCLNTANEIIGKEMTAEQVLEDVLKDKIFYDTSGGGLTITGGEPSFQPQFTLDLLSLARCKGISLAIETCGIGSRDFYKKAADLGTTFLFDIKCLDSSKHLQLTGADNTHILENLHYLMDRDADVIIRLPLIPDCNDSDRDIALLSEFLKKNSGRYRYAEIMPYHTLGTAKAKKIGMLSSYTHDSASPDEIARWHTLFKAHGADVRISE